RSSARSGSSKLTRSPGPRGPSEVRSSVWFITSASNTPPSTAAAVRHAPLTDTESPGDNWSASAVRIRSLAPPSPDSTPSTVPMSATRPVNTSPLPHPRAHQQILADALPVGRQGGGGGGHPVRPHALHCRAFPPQRDG